jgi:hypothetical protein
VSDPLERFRTRLTAAGADVPDELLGLVLAMAGPLVTAIDALAALDFGDVEPFVPSRRLVEDATE